MSANTRMRNSSGYQPTSSEHPRRAHSRTNDTKKWHNGSKHMAEHVEQTNKKKKKKEAGSLIFFVFLLIFYLFLSQGRRGV
jgi:hypothetical protein